MSVKENFKIYDCVAKNNSQLISIVKYAFEKCGCDGVYDYQLEESEVDALLGERAYSGGDIPLDLYDELENSQEQNSNYKFYFRLNNQKSVQNVMEFENYLVKQCIRFQSDECESADWNAEWRKHYKKIYIGDELTIVPEWELKTKLDNEVYINPGQGFGTGDHETTFLCLQLYCELRKDIELKNSRVLDFGCGSGILGASSIKLDNTRCDFVDIDVNALDNAVYNLSLNFEKNGLVGSSVQIRERFTLKNTYDLVFANILLQTLIEEQKIIKDSLNKSGHLIISGLLVDQVDEFLKNFNSCSNFKVESILKKATGVLFFCKNYEGSLNTRN